MDQAPDGAVGGAPSGAPSGTPHEATGGRWDLLARSLQDLRHAAGEPSYAEIARRVSERRTALGADPHAARVARTTVYDVFRAGRSRVNLPLVREVAAVLGGDDAGVDAWVAASRAAAPTPGAAEREVPAPVTEPPAARPWSVALVLVACTVLNVAGGFTVTVLELPIFLDMVGTAVAAIALGPWWGAGVGLASNLAGTLNIGWEAAPFALVNVAGALVWGYGVRRLGLGRTLGRYFSLQLLVACVCTVVAVPILVLVVGGGTGHDQESLRDLLHAVTDQVVVAVGFSNLLLSVLDKVLSGFLALVAVSAMPVALVSTRDLVLVTRAGPGDAG